MAFAVRIVRRIHQDVVADQVDDGIGQLGPDQPTAALVNCTVTFGAANRI